MTNIPSVANYIQQEAVQAYAPDSESTLFAIGGTSNYLLDHYPMPPGMTIPFNGLEIDVNLTFMIPQDGRAVSRTVYADLFAAIGTLHGVGDGLTTFNVPDKRGYFERMVDLTSAGQAGRDPDHASRTPTGTGTSEEAGSIEPQSFLSHTHGIIDTGGTDGPGVYASPASSAGRRQTDPAGGDETRPINYYVLLCIKT